jgi:FkbM family methyltransferase
MRRIIREAASVALRALPPFRGKARLGASLCRLLTDYGNQDDCMVMARMRDGGLMRIDLRSRSEVWAYWTGEYDSAIIARLVACLSHGSVVMDVGANVGFYTVTLGKRLQELGGKLYSIEPVPSNYQRLTEQITLNGMEDTVIPCNLAFGDREGALQFAMESSYGGSTGNAVITTGNAYFANENADETVQRLEAKMVRLDDFAREYDIQACNLIKVDIEGAELMFLRGAESFLKRTRPIIYGEFNAYWMRQFGSTFRDIAQLVESWGYKYYKLEGRSRFVPVEQPHPGLEDVLLAPVETSRVLLSRMGVTVT